MCYQCRNRRKIPASIEIQHIHFAYVHRTSTYMCIPALRMEPAKTIKRRDADHRSIIIDANRDGHWKTRYAMPVGLFHPSSFTVSARFSSHARSTTFASVSPRSRPSSSWMTLLDVVPSTTRISYICTYTHPVGSNMLARFFRTETESRIRKTTMRQCQTFGIVINILAAWNRPDLGRGHGHEDLHRGKKRGPIEKKDENNVEGSMEVHSAKTRGV